MGQFEMKEEKSINLKPDIVELTVNCNITEYVKGTVKTIEETKEKLKETVSKLRISLKEIEGILSIGNSNLIYSETKNSISNNNQAKIFGKKEDNDNVLKATVKITIKSKLEEDTIKAIMTLLLDTVDIITIYDKVSVSDLEERVNELKAELSKKCRKDAENIVACLGSEITGIDKIVYNSNGLLLSSNNNNAYAINNRKVAKREAFQMDADCYIDSDFGAISDIEQINQEWVDGFVTTILEREYPISDSITVVFNVR